MKKHICPICGNDKFSVTAHVTQTWQVNATGEFESAISECDEVTHTPSNADIWTCTKCGYDAAGYKFEKNAI